MTTKTPIELSSTPSVVDNGNATAITIDSSERVGILQGSPTSNLHIGASGNDAKRELRIDGTNGSGQTFGFITEADGENGRVSFKVGQSNATPAQKLMIHPDGGICFGSDTAAANALDDYEEGTYTPIMNSSNLTYTYQLGWYVKIGRHVTVGIHIDINTNGNGSGVAIGDISLPFAPSLGGATYYAMTSTIWCNGWSTATKSDVGLVSHDYSYIVTRKAAGQANVATPTHGDLGGGNMLMTVSYQTA